MNLTDTIAAVSTPRGKGGVALLRVSGDDAVTVAGRVFFPASGKPLSATGNNRAVYGKIRAGGEEIDDGIATVYRAPHSFTGEDTVEITCHGGVLVTAEVLDALLAAGARAAAAGEFTRRAFLSGKLGLSRAEALGNLLDAGTHAQLRLARSGLDGRLENGCRALYDELCDVISNVYATIDYPEEDLSSLSREEIDKRLSEIGEKITRLAATYQSGKAIAEGIRTVICGKPNVGKSSLYNRIVGSDAAIVTEIAGTTRDILEETASLGDVTLRLCDTAGMHAPGGDAIEKIGMERAEEKILDAELILAVFDGSRPLDGEDERFLSLISSASGHKIGIVNKNDLPRAVDEARLSGFFDTLVTVDTRSEGGIDALRDAVRNAFLGGDIDLSRDAIVANARQHAALLRAGEALSRAIDALRLGIPEDVYGGEIEEAMSALSELDGREVDGDIVDRIFSKFCVGK